MNILLNNKQKNSQGKVYFLFEKDELLNVEESIKTSIEKFIIKEKIKGEAGEVFSFIKENGDEITDVILIGLGKVEELSAEKLRVAASKALKKARELKIKSLELSFIENSKLSLKEVLASIIEGVSFTNYSYTEYKSDKDKDKNSVEDIAIVNIPDNRLKEAQTILEEIKLLVETTLIARDLVNEPANDLYPEKLASNTVALGEEYGFNVEVLDENEIRSLGMDALYAVAKGSDNAPRFIVMRYFGDEQNKDNILGLVGKGLTYDSGGYSLKPTDGMLTMKSDMGGAASVIGAMAAIAKQKLKVNVVAVVAACENMISGKAYKPGDVIGSMAGKTIEIMNTDAEGRLTLADAVYYIVEKEKASKVIDVATLTGAALVALGVSTTAVITNNDEFCKELIKASEEAGERMWQLPSYDDYKKLLKSDIADLKNTGGRYAGTITAGLFIGEFVQGKPWLHLDIAGTSWADNEKDYYTKGATGVGVRTLYYTAKNMVK